MCHWKTSSGQKALQESIGDEDCAVSWGKQNHFREITAKALLFAVSVFNKYDFRTRNIPRQETFRQIILSWNKGCSKARPPPQNKVPILNSDLGKKKINLSLIPKKIIALKQPKNWPYWQIALKAAKIRQTHYLQVP